MPWLSLKIILTHKIRIANTLAELYNISTMKDRLQGRENFPTGGKVREPNGRTGVIPVPTV